MSFTVDRLRVHPPRYASEWGSGGIFGLKYNGEVLYYTLAFEAEAHFLRRDGSEEIYRFEQVGGPPRSGGDTYNAVDAVDDEIFFGGWVHAPARVVEEEGFKVMDFTSKYSHVHRYDVDEHRVELLWSSTAGKRSQWTGEVSEITYNPIRDSIILARADGHTDLGVYELDRRGRSISRISRIPALKGSIYMDYVCFDIPDFGGIKGFQYFNLENLKHEVYWLPNDIAEISVDGYGTREYSSGCSIQIYGRYVHFVKGGLFIGSPVDPEFEKPVFARLFDFGELSLSPRRANAVATSGGILVPFNSYVESAVKIPEDKDRRKAKLLNTSIAPTVLLFLSPPVARIVAVLGARATSLEKAGSKILVGCNTTANLGGYDVTRIDAGIRTVTALEEDHLLCNIPPILIRAPSRIVGREAFGGIPVTGYKSRKLTILASRNNKLSIHEYLIGPPPTLLSTEQYDVNPGRNVIDLEGYMGIVSFKLEKEDPEGSVLVELT